MIWGSKFSQIQNYVNKKKKEHPRTIDLESKNAPQKTWKRIQQLSSSTLPGCCYVQPSPAVIGQPATVKLCSTSGTDPWLSHDPWKPASSVGSSVSTPSAPALAELEERIEASILSKMPKSRLESMEVDDTHDRLAALETQLQQVTTRQVNLEGSVREHQAQSNAQIQTLQSDDGSTGLSEQADAIHAARSDVAH